MSRIMVHKDFIKVADALRDEGCTLNRHGSAVIRVISPAGEPVGSLPAHRSARSGGESPREVARIVKQLQSRGLLAGFGERAKKEPKKRAEPRSSLSRVGVEPFVGERTANDRLIDAIQPPNDGHIDPPPVKRGEPAPILAHGRYYTQAEYSARVKREVVRAMLVLETEDTRQFAEWAVAAAEEHSYQIHVRRDAKSDLVVIVQKNLQRLLRGGTLYTRWLFLFELAAREAHGHAPPARPPERPVKQPEPVPDPVALPAPSPSLKDRYTDALLKSIEEGKELDPEVLRRLDSLLGT